MWKYIFPPNFIHTNGKDFVTLWGKGKIHVWSRAFNIKSNFQQKWIWSSLCSHLCLSWQVYTSRVQVRACWWHSSWIPQVQRVANPMASARSECVSKVTLRTINLYFKPKHVDFCLLWPIPRRDLELGERLSVYLEENLSKC